MFDTIDQQITYETRGGAIITENATIKRKVMNYKNKALADIESYFRKVSQFHKLCSELGFNSISLKTIDKDKDLPF